MEYCETIRLKDGNVCRIRNGTQRDGAAALACFILTHAQTDELFSYPDEISTTLEQEEKYLKEKAESPDEIELLAEIDGRVVGLAGVDRVGKQDKVKHRATFGISIDQGFWGLGIGRAMTRACIACAQSAGYAQLELEAVADNERAVALYRSEGFVEYGRNPKGFRSRHTGWQEIVMMRLELEKRDETKGGKEHEKQE